MISFEQFVRRLPRAEIELKTPLTSSFRVVNATLAEFVAPDLRHRSDIAPEEQGQIVLITAPAAVGKSTFASQLAYLLKSPIWDLARAPSIGAGALDGQMNMNFGRDIAAKFLNDVENGRGCIIIDALDEARIRITESTFSDFLKSIADMARNARGLSFIILGRKQVIEDAWLYISSHEISAPIYEISYFDKNKSIEFLDRYVVKFAPEQEQVRSGFRVPYENARNSIISAIEKSVPEENVSDFIGYAPVLMAIARALSEERNFYAVAQRWAAAPEELDSGAIAIVRSLIEEILQREQRKYQDNAPEALKAMVSPSVMEGLYGSREQAYRVLFYMHDKDDRSRQLSSRLPDHAADLYEESIEEFLREHPFLLEGSRVAANVVFRDYLYALMLKENDALSADIISDHSRLSGRPSPLLFEFFFGEGGRDVVHRIDATHMGMLYESALASETIDRNVQLSLESGDSSSSELEGSFEFFTDEARETIIEPRVVQFSTTVVSCLVFSRILSHADIDIDGCIKFSSPSKEFEFVGDVWISARDLVFDVESIVIRPRRPERPTEDARQTTTSIHGINVQDGVSRPPKVFGTLQVDFPGAERYPWGKFKSSLPDTGDEGDDYERAERILRRIVTAFRSHSRGSLARFRDKIESSRVSRGALGKRLLHQLIGDGILRLEGRFYYLNPEQCANRLGVTYYDLKNRELTPRATEYLNQFLRVQ
ncbi:hypothetical protein [Propylenella binzhouense]|uniref:hypothetical protein n=1 Tax=Propylenella binzhouense TaxID=2555902 RepID=UPI0013696488|nr:hypothetical protein [Propylenella binzhouense]